MTDKKYRAPAVEKLLSIMEVMANENRSFTVTELSNRLNCSVNSIYRIMAELQLKKYVVKNDLNSSYQLSNKLYYLGSLIANKISLRKLAQKSMDTILEETRETTLLASLNNNMDTVIIDQLESPEPLKFVSTVGFSYPSYTSALGKVILAFRDEKYIDRYIKATNFVKLTKNTITNSHDFRIELENIKARGYALDLEESFVGLKCIAAPVLNSHNKVEASIGISCLSLRLTDEKIKIYSHLIVEETNKISKLMGNIL